MIPALVCLATGAALVGAHVAIVIREFAPGDSLEPWSR